VREDYEARLGKIARSDVSGKANRTTAPKSQRKLSQPRQFAVTSTSRLATVSTEAIALLDACSAKVASAM